MDTTELSRGGHGPGTDAALAFLILLLGTFLAGSGAQLTQRLHSSAARRQSLSFEDHLAIAANTTGLIIVAWWVLSFLIAVTAALLERSGSRRAAVAAGRFSPAFMRRLALAAVGLQLATAPLAYAGPGSGAPAPPTPPAVAAAWTPTGGAVGADPRWAPAPPPVDPRALAPLPLRQQKPAAGAGEVTVRAGDSLWSICAAELGPLASDVDIALAWPRLYQANRKLIGSDPGLLLPGQVLRLPANP
ncbi:LysM domain-containing protein [uncultured Arthrobacter sp.]|uniref:LysM peptidoglycan-binding domain-containing protein n=1 Tax=uncultured Arthrobacter sp. TaxID=114050 RepID=UPI003216E27F